VGIAVTQDAASAPTEPSAFAEDKSLPVAVRDYYRSAYGLSGDALRAKLRTIIGTGLTRYSYTDCWTQLSYTDEDPANPSNIIEIYTGWSVPKANYGSGTNSNKQDYWNREHVYAKSHGAFGTATGPGTDLHHLRPADISVNSPRGNLDYDNGGNEYVDSTLPPGVTDGHTGCRYDSDSWEPRDADKGDIARMCFYMALMYDGSGGGDSVDLNLNDSVGNGSAPYIGKLSVLEKWSEADPPSSYELRRNDRIQERQGNRNPFIDYPGLADLINVSD
jgi:endonuclease I